MVMTKEQITKILLKLKGNTSRKGFRYTVEAIHCISKNPDITLGKLREYVAMTCGSTASKVERDIRSYSVSLSQIPETAYFLDQYIDRSDYKDGYMQGAFLFGLYNMIMVGDLG